MDKGLAKEKIMLRYISCGFIFVLAYLFAVSVSAASIAHKQYASIKDFLAGQRVIRIIADDTSGYGLQVASMNLMTTLRQLGFNGKFEFIYSTRVTDKITTLFDLPHHIPDVYEDTKDGIQFVSLNEFIQRHKNNTASHYTLAMTGGMDTGPCGLAARSNIDIYHNMGKIDCVNHANFFDTTVFAQLVTFYKYPNFIYVANNANYELFRQMGSTNKFITAPITTLHEAKRYLQHDARGQVLSKQKPALAPFIKGMEKQRYNVLPIYGITLQANCRNGKHIGCFPGNILQIIAGARYAQLNGPKSFHKPLIITVFYDYENEAKQIMQLLHKDHWDQYEIPGAMQARKTLNDLGVPGALSIANISDPNTIHIIHDVKPGQIVLLWLGPLPKKIFDGLYNYTHPNIWPQIREGNNSFASLILTGRSHIRCGNKWELGDTFMTDPQLKIKFAALYNERGLCRGMTTWNENTNLYQELGNMFIAANDLQSPLSRYFTVIRKNITDPKNDRLHYALQEVLRIVNTF